MEKSRRKECRFRGEFFANDVLAHGRASPWSFNFDTCVLIVSDTAKSTSFPTLSTGLLFNFFFFPAFFFSFCTVLT